MSDRRRDVIGPGKVAVVTGGGSGIGAALAERLAAMGSAVVVADLDVEAATAVAEGIRARGGTGLPIAVDVSDPTAVDDLARATIDAYGRVDVLCNNAGVSTFNLLRDQTLDDWRWVLDVNLWGVVHGLHSFLPIMRAQGTPGHVVSTASIAGLESGIAFIGPYNASKVAVVSISETLRKELAMEGSPIGVSVLCPSSVDTRILDAERGRPPERGTEQRTDVAEMVRTGIRDTFTGPAGMTPEGVAGIVVDAIERDRFWIITHPDERGVLPARFDEILANVPQSLA